MKIQEPWSSESVFIPRSAASLIAARKFVDQIDRVVMFLDMVLGEITEGANRQWPLLLSLFLYSIDLLWNSYFNCSSKYF